MKRLAGMIVMALVAGAMVTAKADTVFVSGVVRDSVSNAVIANAVVTVSAGTRSNRITAIDTTNASGQYSVALVNDTFPVFRVTVTATGYIQTSFRGVEGTVENPKDGVTDRITVDIKLLSTGGPVTADTIVITGLVQDSINNNPIAGATVTVTAFSGMTFKTATGTSANNGSILMKEAWGQVVGVNAVIQKAGYASKQVNAQLVGDTVKLGTIRLVAVSPTDTLTYTFAGRVQDAQGAGLGDAIVTVTFKNATSTIYTGKDTTLANGFNRGRFSLNTRQANITSPSVTIEVMLEGYATFDTTFVPAGQQINLLITMQQATGVVVRSAKAVPMYQSTKAATFTINGRAMASTRNATGKTLGNQITVSKGKGAAKVVSAR